MNRVVSRSIVILLFCFGVSKAQTTAPAELVESPDKLAVKTATTEFVMALTNDDISDAKKLFGGSDENFKTVEQMHKVVVAVKAYKAAASKQFPGYEKGRHMSDDMDPKAMAERVKHQSVTITGDTAKMQDGTKLQLIDGKWKVVDLVGDPNSKRMMNQMLPAFIKAADDTTPEIAQGKYATFDDADKAMQGRMRAAVMAMAKNLGATSQPTTAPGH